MIAFDKKKQKAFQEAYEKARDAGAKSFVFNGHEFLVDYAKYVIEYLQNERARREK